MHVSASKQHCLLMYKYISNHKNQHNTGKTLNFTQPNKNKCNNPAGIRRKHWQDNTNWCTLFNIGFERIWYQPLRT